ncbi:hypothetical protein EVAR_86048_1 [Eumeta japonica]|uniref:Uncharacterized protein n=1 Tax=Eumeta variegata TaxID=151549 RepID=A0A4C1UJE9_EUMVA|nr:hypothetical protein EVAR_86048_1 [Eumeta japonica]
MGVAVDRLKKVGNQKVVLSCSSAEVAKKIEEWLKIPGADLKIRQDRQETAYSRYPGRPQNKFGREHRQFPVLKCQMRSVREPPKCINSIRAGRRDAAYGAFSSECSVRHKWDEKTRSKETYVGNIGELRQNPRCRVVQKANPLRGPVKAAIITLDSGVDVEEDQILINEKVTVTVIKAENCTIGFESLYFERYKPIAIDAALTERAVTVEMMKFVDSCDQHDEIVGIYTECIRQAREIAISPRKSEGKLELP